MNAFEIYIYIYICVCVWIKEKHNKRSDVKSMITQQLQGNNQIYFSVPKQRYFADKPASLIIYQEFSRDSIPELI